jgi:hypothetical protein
LWCRASSSSSLYTAFRVLSRIFPDGSHVLKAQKEQSNFIFIQLLMLWSERCVSIIFKFALLVLCLNAVDGM